MSWEILPLPRLGYLLLHQNGMEKMRRHSCCSHSSPLDSKITLYLLVSPQGNWTCPCWHAEGAEQQRGYSLPWSSCAQQHQQTESSSKSFGALSHLIPGKLLLVTYHSKTSQRWLRKTEIILCMREIQRQHLPAACPPLFHAHPLNVAVSVPISRGCHTCFPPQTMVSHQNPFASASQNSIPATLHFQQGKWRHGFPGLVPIFLGISWILKGESLRFPALWETVSATGRVTEELQNAIACMTDYEHFPSPEKKKDNWPGQVEKGTVSGAGAAWEQGTEPVTWTQPHLTPAALQKLQSFPKGQSGVRAGHEPWWCFRGMDQYSWHGKVARDEAEERAGSTVWLASQFTICTC